MKNLEQKGDYRLMQILNLAGFVLVVVINFLANYLPINNLDTGEISDMYPNLFTPAGFTFAIWGLIYLLLGIFAIYQARGLVGQPAEPNPLVKRIGYLFFISCILNSAWIFAWHYLQIGLSLLIMVLLLINLLVLYYQIHSVENKKKQKGYLFIAPAFSIYVGWITIATVANVTAFLVGRDWGAWGLSEVFWMVVITLVATGIVLAFMYKNRDWLYSLVALWAYFGIVVERATAEVVKWPVIVVVILCMAIIAYAVYMVVGEKRKAGEIL